MYSYVLNNPINATDPTGMECVWDEGDHDDNGILESGGIGHCPAISSSFQKDSGALPAGHCGGILCNLGFLFSGVGDSGRSWNAYISQIEFSSLFQGGGSGGTRSGAAAANNGWTWAWDFTKSFFTFAGGPGNKPTCAGQTLRNIANDLSGGLLKSKAAETSLKAVGEYETAAAIKYAAGRPNSLGGIGLICPSCSSVFRRMMSKAEFLGEASEAVPLVETSYAAGSSIPEVSAQARNGECAAAFPVF